MLKAAKPHKKSNLDRPEITPALPTPTMKLFEAKLGDDDDDWPTKCIY
jgi:hypothetical protein